MLRWILEIIIDTMEADPLVWTTNIGNNRSRLKMAYMQSASFKENIWTRYMWHGKEKPEIT